jgi:arylsulfatase A-like enzyme
MPTRPNILLVFTDQQRFDTIAALGNPVIRTPAMDRLVREGVAFTRAYTPSPVCVSARCALLTGRHPHRNGCVDNSAMDQSLPSLMDRLSAGGYECWGVGKMHFTPDWRKLWGFAGRDLSEECNAADDFRAFLNGHGYAHVHDPHGVRSEYYYLPQPSQLPAALHNTAWVVDRSLDFLARRDRARPFFLWTSFIKPHPPFENPTPWNKLYRCPAMPLPKRVAGGVSGGVAGGVGERDLHTYWNRFQNRYKYRDQGLDDNLLRTMKAAYYGCISFIDYHLGRLLADLEARGELDDTLVLLSADHGELLGDYGCFGKRSMLDSAARIPLLALWPGRLPAGQRCAAPTSLIDIAPTCLHAAGLDPDPAHAGLSLLDVAAGRTAREFVISQFQAGRQGVWMLATRTHKYCWSAPDEREWLFDLVSDPTETRDCAANPLYRAVTERLRGQLIALLRADGYDEPLDGDGWRRWGKLELSPGPDAHLLFQDPPPSVACPAEGYA